MSNLDARKILIGCGGLIVAAIVGGILLLLLSALIDNLAPILAWVFGLAVVGLAVIAVVYFVIWL